MRRVTGSLIFFVFVELLVGFPSETEGIKLPGVNPIKTVGSVVGSIGNIGNVGGIVADLGEIAEDKAKGAKDKAKDVREKAKDVGEAVKDVGSKVPQMVGEVAEHIPNPIDAVKNISELVSTTAVFTRGNVTLNCFGLPIIAFAKVIEGIFTQNTKAEDVKFYFSSGTNTYNLTVKLDDPSILENIDFDVTRPTVLLVHGFMSSGKELWMKEMRDAFLKLNNVNVIVVDWQRGSNTWNYYSAALSTRIVGEQIAKLFAHLRDLSKLKVPDINQWGTIYFIGHSLGSHISAHAAYLIKESQKSNPKKWIVNRITGLDPAQPCFKTTDLSLKLDKNDAEYVDVIHTNARQLLFLGFGLSEQLGFADFYPNGGKAQPGCSDIDASFWSFLLLPVNIIKESICSHGRSHTFLIESVVDFVRGNCTFVGYLWNRSGEHSPRILEQKCAQNECTEMGINSVSYYPHNSGIYFVPTRSTAPYCGEEDEQARNHRSSGKNVFSRIVKDILH